MINPNKIEEMARTIQAALPPGLKSVGEEVDKKVKQVIQAQLMKLVPVFTQASGIQLEQLRFDAKRGEFRLQASGAGYQDFDRFRQLADPLFTVKPGDMKSENGKVRGTLVLRSKS